MRKRTQEYFEKRVGQLRAMLEFPEVDWQMQLHSYMPGDRKLYQIQIVDKRDGSVEISMPKDKSYNSMEFEIYLEGIFAAAHKLEGMWRDY